MSILYQSLPHCEMLRGPSIHNINHPSSKTENLVKKYFKRMITCDIRISKIHTKSH